MAAEVVAPSAKTIAVSESLLKSRVLADFDRYIHDYNEHNLSAMLDHMDDRVMVFLYPELEVPASKGKYLLRQSYAEDMRKRKTVRVAAGREPTVECRADGTVAVSVGLQTRSTAMDVQYVYRPEDMKQIRQIISNIRDAKH